MSGEVLEHPETTSKECIRGEHGREPTPHTRPRSGGGAQGRSGGTGQVGAWRGGSKGVPNHSVFLYQQ